MAQVSKRLRYEVLRRDNHACRYCGATAPAVKLTVDHVVPVALGGTNEPSNLVTACADCNSGKSSSSPDAPIVDDASADALRWANAMSRAADSLLMDRERRHALRETFLAHWNGWTYKDWKSGEQVTVELPGDWRGSVDQIMAAGLPIEVLCECVDIAMGHNRIKDEFRYMCGVAWRKVGELREIAGALLETDLEP